MFASRCLRREVQDRLATTTTCRHVFRATSRCELIDGSAEKWHYHEHVGHGNHNYHRRQCYHTNHKFPMARRNLWDTCNSGFHGLIALVTSRENIEDFQKGMTDKIIHDVVRTQARFGNLLAFALYYDLYQNPLWSKAEFEITDFLEGVVPALEQYHDIEGRLLNEFPPVDRPEKRAELLIKHLSKVVSVSGANDDSKNENQEGNKDGNERVKVSENSWVDHAKKDPDSLAGQISGMVTPSVMDFAYFSTQTAAFLKTYQSGSTSIENVALLSARVIEVEEERYNNEQDTSTDDNASKTKNGAGESANDSSESTKNAGEESNHTPLEIAAQIEVLYDLKQTFIPKEFKLKEGEKDAVEFLEEISKLKSEENQKTREETKLLVGTFEGWLKGGPDGELQWRISNLRHPHHEFPEFTYH